MKLQKLIPAGTSILRIGLAFLVFYSYINGLQIWAILLFTFAVFTDFLDGYLARKLKATTNGGAYLDTFADFILILITLSAFIIKGLYPYWILILIIFMYIQFVLTSGIKKPIYDPLGKYYVGLLFVSIGITMIFPLSIVSIILLVIITVFSIIMFINRLFIILRH